MSHSLPSPGNLAIEFALRVSPKGQWPGGREGPELSMNQEVTNVATANALPGGLVHSECLSGVFLCFLEGRGGAKAFFFLDKKSLLRWDKV